MAAPAPHIAFLAQPNIDGYDTHKSPADQPATARESVPQTFLDAMVVRHAVFIQEQQVPLESEVDEDDPISCHWVAYEEEGANVNGARNSSTPAVGRRQPIGNIRLVPYPQPPHPLPGGVYSIIDGAFVLKGRRVKKDGSPGDSEEDEFVPARPGDPPELTSLPPDHATSLHDGTEPYVKLGRLAVLKEARKQRLGQHLVRTALDWMVANPRFFDLPAATGAGGEIHTPAKEFSGLVCVHGQVQAALFWERMGFAVDKKMGTWWEEGIPHWGMFRRLDLKRS